MDGNLPYNSRWGWGVVIAGGTLDFYRSPKYELHGGDVDVLVPRKESLVPTFLKNRIKIREDEIGFGRACLKDSRDMTEKDGEKILNEIIKSPFKYVIVTHGTETMDETAAFLKQHKDKLKDKVIGIVGSLMTLTDYMSDAGFHIGFALAELHKKKSGIHLFHPKSIRDATKKILREVVVITTGGTIDSEYDESTGHEMPRTRTLIPTYLAESIDVSVDEPKLTFQEVCTKDSRNLTKEDRDKLFRTSKNNGSKKQIITLGTYGLPDHAARWDGLIGESLAHTTYLFIGSMWPTDVSQNDGWFNLGFAIGKITDLKPGAYVTMHGWVTHPHNVDKDLYEGKLTLRKEMPRF